MTKIKFRAKDKFSDQWIFGQAFFIDSDNNEGYIANGIGDHHMVRKETVGQCIGLKGKNDKEIYEGDIVEFNDVRDDIGSVGLVVYGNGSYCIEREYIRHYRWMDYDVEVIGNVYENPELINDVLSADA